MDKKLKPVKRRRFNLQRTFTKFLNGLWNLRRRMRGWLAKSLSGIKKFFLFRAPKWVLVNRGLSAPVAKKPTWRSWVNPIHWIVWTSKFTYSWLISRPYLNLGPALPAIIVGALLLGAMILFQLRGERQRGAMYRTLLTTAINTKDLDQQALILDVLIDRYPENEEYRYMQAAMVHDSGETEIAMGLMKELAVSRKYGTAAMWVLLNDFDLSLVADWPKEKHQEFNFWMSISLTSLRGDNLESAKTMMASYFSSIGAVDNALRFISELAPKNPSLALIAAAMCAQNNQIDESKRYAAIAKKHYEELFLGDPNNDEHRIELAKSMILLGEYQPAAKLLNDGYQASGSKTLKLAATEALVTWSNSLAAGDQGSNNLPKRLQILWQALQWDPNNASLIRAIVDIAIACNKDERSEVVTLRKSLVEGIAPESIHFIQGTIALMEGKPEQARIHLELAAQNGTNLAGVLNNLAMAMLESNSDELEQALALSNSANEMLPNHPYLRDTRGSILLKLERYQESISDLEFALPTPELSAAVHRKLAAAYRALGELEIADEHLRQAGP